MAEDVHIEERSALELEHEEERVEDDEEEDEVLKGSGCTQTPQLKAATEERLSSRIRIQQSTDRIPEVSEGT